MNFLQKLEQRASQLWYSNSPAPDWVYDVLGAARTSSGIRVGPKNALENTPALRAIRLICESLSCIPFNLMEEDADGDKRIARTEDIHWLLHDEPNEFMCSPLFRQVVQLHVLTHGNGYIYIERNAATRRPVGLLPLVPESTYAHREKSGALVYKTQGNNGAEIALDPADIIAIPWLTWDGLTAESPVRLGKRSIGLGIAAEESVAKLFGQGMLTNAVIEQQPGSTLNGEALDNLKQAIEAKFGGLGNNWRPIILQPGLSWKNTGMELDKAQAKELREMQVADAARIYGTPLHLLAAGDKTSTYASVEQFELIYNKHTMLPWYYLWELSFNLRLLSRDQRRGVSGRRLFTKFNPKALLRGDVKSQMEAHEIAIRNGLETIEEGRDIEDLPRTNVPQAKEPLIMASQLAPLSSVGKKPIEPATAPATPKRDDVRALYLQQARNCIRQLADSVERIDQRFTGQPERRREELHDALGRISNDYSLFDLTGFDRAVREAVQNERPLPALTQSWRALPPETLLELPKR